jgi:hypothetical protein
MDYKFSPLPPLDTLHQAGSRCWWGEKHLSASLSIILMQISDQLKETVTGDQRGTFLVLRKLCRFGHDVFLVGVVLVVMKVLL